ncbi:efflux transporter outer membrane subunit [Pseudomonas extremaustralis]|uniref:efflux transporter outer membrane subunit n=1 Tax=Pseudomonas extremaustralis TaxID=359110 RepID=UPI0021C95FDB|nr:efflux transporter outer membrane subunit [Pseudomonas extremaustralis]UUJ40880.1 efflux transporter outer membrane subunit [Pseudomonas extremaustralis]
MFPLHKVSPLALLAPIKVGLLTLAMAGCAVGPDFEKPEPSAPADWASWRGADEQLKLPGDRGRTLPAQWWLALGDPVLDQLQRMAFDTSPDLRTAALHYAQARAQRSTVAAQRGPQVNASGGVTRQRQSESGSGTRLIASLAENPDPLVKELSEPFDLYQAGIDVSWELDLWGRIGRSIEAADADIHNQQALLDLARLSLTCDIARNYFELRTAQRQIALTREDLAALEDRLGLLEARVEGGMVDHFDLERQRAELDALKAQLPPLLAQAGANSNQLTLLLGQRPGSLQPLLASPKPAISASLPDMQLGLPSAVALRRPDIRAAEARLHRATANIGIAEAEMYPSISLGARFGYESYLSGEFSDWGSRTWSVGPSLNLPLFDRGRRKSVVQLRGLEQQEAAVNYQQTVLKAWQEIDDALSAYTAERQRNEALTARARSTEQAYTLAQARYEGGNTDFLAVLDSQRGYLQARRDLASSDGNLYVRYVMVNKAIGNVPVGDSR